MLRLGFSAAFLVCFAVVQVGTAQQQATPAPQGQTRQGQGNQGQSGQTQSGQGQSGQQQGDENAQQGGKPPAFRGGVDFVRVDVIVSDKKAQPVINLTENDFEVLEDGKPVKIEQFKLIKVDGNPVPGGPPPKQIRDRNDEELEAARDDVRIFVFFLDDYHVRKANSMSVRPTLQ